MTETAHAILLVGAGELGSRHLQSLASLAGCQIDVIEPSAAACQTAATRLAQVTVVAEVNFFQSFDVLKSSYDVAIIATSAAVRFEVTQQLLSKTKLKYLILEKVLFQRPEYYQALQHQLAAHQVSAFVNCPRRLYPLYRQLKARLSDGPVSITVSGENWGMACNSIHFLDLLMYLTEEHLSVIDTTALQDSFASKRPGFLEVSGRLVARFQSGSTVTLQCETNDTNTARVAIELQSAAGHWRIDEAKGRLECLDSGTLLLDGLPMLFQSQLTAHVAHKLLQHGSCDLTSYSDSAVLHLPLINSLLAYFNKTQGPMDLCPIT
jgi:predicted dehydrogenase